MSKQLADLLKERILILDGAMGTMIQKYKLTEADYRGTEFKDVAGDMKGNNDMLCITQPQIIKEIHKQYLDAGADIIETNTFSSTSISMADYGLQKYVKELNLAGAKLAREVADEYTRKNPEKPRFVVGSIGPTNKAGSISPDVANPAFRAISFDQLAVAFKEQILALIEGSVDALLIETCFDTLNVKAALFAAEQAMQELQKKVPIMLSITISGKSGRMLAGQTLDALLASVEHAEILSVGLNCSFGASDMKPFLKDLAKAAPYFISAYPNAGLPNSLGQYDESPEKMASQIKEYIEEGLVNILGGCCGTTPQHIATYAALIKGASPRIPAEPVQELILSGLESLKITHESNFVNIGERCNVAGSKKFLRLIKEKNYEEATTIALQQVQDGAQVLDINMDDGLLDAEKEMVTFLHLISSDPDIARIPIMLDSSKWEVIEAGLKCLQGKSIVNSISLKNGEEDFLEKAHLIKSYGAAVVVMAFDEKGQADTFERKIEICTRAYKLLTEKAAFKPWNIIFDPNILAIATGMDTDSKYGLDFIRATEWIKQNLPHAKVSGGVSNLSFSFRGNNYLRECLHSIFLYHAIKKGMDVGIVNPSTSVIYEEIPADLLRVGENAILNLNEHAMEDLIEYAQNHSPENDSQLQKGEKQQEWRNASLEERLEHALIKGIPDYMEEDLQEALQKYPDPIQIIDQILMSGMNKVGDLFGSGKMFLPQVVKTARTMKKAVAILQPAIEASHKKSGALAKKNGKQLMATVKGDVHDIGKNIVSVVMGCNNYDIIDLGVMVPASEIIKMAIEQKVDIVGLSGLITPSLDEMCNVAEEMEKAGLKIPLLVGGATTSKLHTALKIAPRYSGPVFHVKDASLNPVVASKLLNPDSYPEAVAKVRKEQEELRTQFEHSQLTLLPLAEAKAHRFNADWEHYVPCKPKVEDVQTISIPLDKVIPFINWKFFFAAWRVSGNYENLDSLKDAASIAEFLKKQPEDKRAKAEEAVKLYQDAIEMLDELEKDSGNLLQARFGFFETHSSDQNLIIEKSKDEVVKIPVLRQQIQKTEKGTPYYALTDFIAPDTSGKKDYIGAFVVSIGEHLQQVLLDAEKEKDDYKLILLKSLTDRIAEAGTEYFHHLVRKDFWSYAPQESTDVKAIMKGETQGIRPAVGYPSLPDQSVNFLLDELLDMKQIHVQLTENGAMYPQATVSGFLISHPQATYFSIGKIDQEQLEEYTRMKGDTAENVKKWLIGNL